MTLIEIMVVLAVIGMMMVVGYMAVRHVSKASLREDATEVTAVLRAAHNMSTMTRKHHRVVFDLEEQTYRIETCEGKVKLAKADRDELKLPDPEDLPDVEALLGSSSSMPPELVKSVIGGAGLAGGESDMLKTAAAISGKQLPSECAVPELPNGDADGRGNVRRIRTEEGVSIRRIHVQHLEGAQLDGIVTVNFFPLGSAEKAVIEVGHEDGGQFTVVVHGLTGRVDLEIGEVDVDEVMFRDAAGNDVEER
jgi:prepilin-type N-terminal cleavage/methylation domain-containing protein